MDEMSLRQETKDLILVIKEYENGRPTMGDKLRLVRAKKILEEWLEK